MDIWARIGLTCQKAQWILFGGASNRVYIQPHLLSGHGHGVGLVRVGSGTRLGLLEQLLAMPPSAVTSSPSAGESRLNLLVCTSRHSCFSENRLFPFHTVLELHILQKMAVLNQPATGLLARVDGLYA